MSRASRGSAPREIRHLARGALSATTSSLERGYHLKTTPFRGRLREASLARQRCTVTPVTPCQGVTWLCLRRRVTCPPAHVTTTMATAAVGAADQALLFG